MAHSQCLSRPFARFQDVSPSTPFAISSKRIPLKETTVVQRGKDFAKNWLLRKINKLLPIEKIEVRTQGFPIGASYTS